MNYVLYYIARNYSAKRLSELFPLIHLYLRYLIETAGESEAGEGGVGECCKHQSQTTFPFCTLIAKLTMQDFFRV